jgi:Type VI secretion system/phage-baseplate injector OB domain
MSAGDKRKYWGKYRGTVLNNFDLEGRGRIQAQCADVQALLPTTWALPCIPAGGIQSGVFVVPPPLSNVWIEFEQGDPDYPIWTGSFWGSRVDVPATANLVPPSIPVVMVETTAKNALVICDVPVAPMTGGGVLLRAGASYISCDQSGITMTAPKVMINSPGILTNGVTNINNGALLVNL